MKLKRIYIEITNLCNLNCSFCHNTKRVKKQMSKENFKEILKKIKGYTNTIYLHVKGEPLLHQDLDVLLSLATKYGFFVNITTNGILLKEKLPLLKSSSCIKHINVSLHCEQKNPNYFNDVFSSCDELKEKITIIYRIWTLKNQKFDETTQKIIDNLANHYHLDDKKLSTITVEKNIELVPRVFLDKENQFTWPSLENEVEENGYCYGLKSHIAILVDGTIVPCCLDGEGEIVLGNILEEDLSTILDGERTRKMIEGFQNRCAIEALCKHCSYKNRF